VSYTNPTKILFTLPNLSLTESKISRVLHICRILDRKNFLPFVSVDHRRRLNRDGLRLFHDLDVPVLILRMSPHKNKPARSSMQLFRTAYSLQKYNITIQHSFDYSRCWAEPVVARWGGVKYWITTKTNSCCDGFHWRLRLGLANRVIAQAPTMAQILKDKIPNIADKLITIPSGIDIEVFKPQEIDYSLLKDLGLSPNSLVLGCIASFNKGQGPY